MTQNIHIRNQNFTLHPSGSIFWQEKSILLISDVHLGKISHFRKYGAAVPQNAVKGNFGLLDESVFFFNPKNIYFLGDLFHSYINNEWKFFEQWIAKTKTEIVLIVGNHDIIPAHKYEDLGIQVIKELLLEGFLLTHHPEEREDIFNFSGHIHPAIKIKGNGRQSLQLPCFFKRQNQLILPAFGEFTGSHTLKRTKNDEVYAIADSVVIKI